jgi:hypothetical protein
MYRRLLYLQISLWFTLLALNHLTISTALAQSSGATTGALTGLVADPQGSAIVGATVKLRELGNNRERDTQVGEDGRYYFPQLAPGNYVVLVMAEGFTNAEQTITLNVGTNTNVQVVLIPQGVQDTVEVTAMPDALTRSESSTVINSQAVNNLPINQRNFLDFSLTSARTTPDRFRAISPAATSGLSFNGQSGRANNITIDGVDNNERVTSGVRSTFSQEAVQEFQVVSDNFSAEFGRALGGIVNIVTKTGTNDLHSTTFFLNRNEEISARDAFAARKPLFSQYQFGATLGGPVKKDRAFFFTSFERFSVQQNNIVTIDDATVQSARRQGFNISNGPLPFGVNRSVFFGRLDAQLNASNALYIRYNANYSTNAAFEAFGGLTAQTASGRQRLEENAIVIGNTYLSPNSSLVNETRFLYNRRTQNITPADPTGPSVQLTSDEGLVTLGRQPALPNRREENIFQFINNTSLRQGRQQWRFGLDFQPNSIPDANLTFFNGGQAFFFPLDIGSALGIRNLPVLTALQAFDPSLRTGPQIAALQILSQLLPNQLPGFPRNLPLDRLSLPFVFLQNLGDTAVTTRSKALGLYLQDEIRVRPNLLVKAGVRYDLNRVSRTPDNNGNIAPRFGIAYQPQFLPKLTLRANYGIFFAGLNLGTSSTIAVVSKSQQIANGFPFATIPFNLPGRRVASGTTFATALAQIPSAPQFGLEAQFQPDLRTSYSQQSNLSLNYALTTSTTLTAEYIYVRGTKLLSTRNINPVVRPVDNNLIASALTGRIDTNRGIVQEVESASDSYYHALTLSAERRLSNQLNFRVNYTFSKAIDNVGDPFAVMVEQNDSLQLGAERSLSIQDLRHRFVASGIYDSGNIKNIWLKNLRLATIVTLTAGAPYNLLAGVDLNRNGDLPNVGDRPRQGGVAIARNAGNLPRFSLVDLRLSRIVTLKEKLQLEAIAEVFNLFNRTNISDLNRIFLPQADGSFNLPTQENGRFTAPRERFRSAFAPRQFQFGFRFLF